MVYFMEMPSTALCKYLPVDMIHTYSEFSNLMMPPCVPTNTLWILFLCQSTDGSISNKISVTKSQRYKNTSCSRFDLVWLTLYSHLHSSSQPPSELHLHQKANFVAFVHHLVQKQTKTMRNNVYFLLHVISLYSNLCVGAILKHVCNVFF